MLLVLSVLLLADHVGKCLPDSLRCDDSDVVSTCGHILLADSMSAARNCRCDELCPLYADCCLDYVQPPAANSHRGNKLSLFLALSIGLFLSRTGAGLPVRGRPPPVTVTKNLTLQTCYIFHEACTRVGMGPRQKRNLAQRLPSV